MTIFLVFNVKKHSNFKWILFCSVGDLTCILYHILYLENKMMGKIQVTSLPCSPSSSIVEPMATVVNYVYTIRFLQQFHAAVMVAVWGVGGRLDIPDHKCC